jgi:hypothetical protein
MITEHKEFAETAELLARLQAEASRLQAEHIELINDLAQAPTMAPVSTEARARQILEGQMPATMADTRTDLQARELSARERLAVLPRMINDLAQRLEIIRERARADLLAREPAPDDLWATAQQAVDAAVSAELARRQRIVLAGYGGWELQAPAWLQEAARLH